MNETKKLNILIVEDDPKRYLVFDKIFEQHRVTKATTARAGCRALRRDTFDLILLDHDLEPTHYTESSAAEGTGREVAYAVAALDAPPMTIVHSWNHDGGLAMCGILSDARVPHARIWFSERIGHDLRPIIAYAMGKSRPAREVAARIGAREHDAEVPPARFDADVVRNDTTANNG
jgi:CheY-like chemotaxis protein